MPPETFNYNPGANSVHRLLSNFPELREIPSIVFRAELPSVRGHLRENIADDSGCMDESSRWSRTYPLAVREYLIMCLYT